MSAALDRLTQLETYQEYLDVLSPGQLLVLYLREVYGWNFTEIGDYLGITAWAAALRLKTAAQLLLDAYPHLAAQVQNRRPRAYHRTLPDRTAERERRILDALRNANGDGPLSTAALARLLHIDHRTTGRAVRSLISQGRIRRGRRTRQGYPLYLTDQEKGP